MKIFIKLGFVLSFLAIAAACNEAPPTAKKEAILFRNVTLIDGKGGEPAERMDMLIQGDTIVAIGAGLDSANANVVDLGGKTIMPALITAHAHVGALKGTSSAAENYTRENILSQLKKYQDYGVTTALAMGTDRPMLFESGLRDSSMNGLLPGARLYSAGYGFGVPAGAPPPGSAMDRVFRPANVAQVAVEMDSLVKLQPPAIKMWVDDFGGKLKKMDPAIYYAIIEEAHKRNLRAAAHVYYLSDARRLITGGVDIIAHSIRDSVIDDALVQEMKARNVVYIPTLSLDEFSYIYARQPDWINDAFFKASLEPGVYELITSQKYREDLKNSPDYARNVKGFEIALLNLKKIFDAGVKVSLGTDSGATPLRAQGFSEHLELELMVQAGLTPLQAITVATKNASEALKIDSRYGALEKGKSADFIILGDNPLSDIRNTRKIETVYKAGKEMSKGPLAK